MSTSQRRVICLNCKNTWHTYSDYCSDCGRKYVDLTEADFDAIVTLIKNRKCISP